MVLRIPDAAVPMLDTTQFPVPEPLDELEPLFDVAPLLDITLLIALNILPLLLKSSWLFVILSSHFPKKDTPLTMTAVKVSSNIFRRIIVTEGFIIHFMNFD